MMSKTILFFGNERIATGVTTTTPVLRALLAAGYVVPAVIVAQDDTIKSRTSRRLEISDYAISQNINVLSVKKLKDSVDLIAQFKADAAVLVAYGKIIPQVIIDLFPKGIINIHPSLLPKHRGPTPLESVILDGDVETGVSLMRLATKMDAGPIFAQKTIKTFASETKQQLADRLSMLGESMLIDYLPAILDNSLQPTDQLDDSATYDQLIKKNAGRINQDEWAKPVSEIQRMVLAYSGWPRVRTSIGNHEVILTQTHPEVGSIGNPGDLYLHDKQLGIYAADGVLLIEYLIPVGKKEMAASAFLAGYKL